MHALEPKGEQNRRLAELALLNDKPPKAGPCPEAETLAALVEGGLEDRQRDQVLAHIAACPECQRLWRQLDREWQEQAGAQPQTKWWRRIPGRGGYLAAGSLFAAAASLVLFLNLTHQGSRMPLVPLSPPAQTAPAAPPVPAPSTAPLTEQAGPRELAPAAAREYSRRPSPETEQRAPLPTTADHLRSEAPTNTLAGGKPAPASPAKAALREQTDILAPDKTAAAKEKKAELPAAAAIPAPPTGRARLAAEPAPEPRGIPPTTASSAAPALAQKAGQAEENPQPQAASSLTAQPTGEGRPPDQAAVDAAGRLSRQGWLDGLHRGCRQDAEQRGVDFFTLAARQGRQLLTREQGLSPADRRQLATLIGVLETQLPPQERCQRVLQLLAPAGSPPRTTAPGTNR